MSHNCIQCGGKTVWPTRLNLPICSRECGKELIRTMLGRTRHENTPVTLADYGGIESTTDFYKIQQDYNG